MKLQSYFFLYRESLILEHVSDCVSIENSWTEMCMIVLNTSCIRFCRRDSLASKRKIFFAVIKIPYPSVNVLHLWPCSMIKFACMNMMLIGNCHDVLFCTSVGEFILHNHPTLSSPEHCCSIFFWFTKRTIFSTDKFSISENFFVLFASTDFGHIFLSKIRNPFH